MPTTGTADCIEALRLEAIKASDLVACAPCYRSDSINVAPWAESAQGINIPWVEPPIFSNQFKKDQEVYVNGTRGSLGPFKVDEGKGKYKLRKEDGEKMKKMYDEGDLGIQPKLV
ncbi:MAG: hypothetical protein Q9184_006143 [Pyrenodesmia sp. 2 TL-2023]